MRLTLALTAATASLILAAAAPADAGTTRATVGANLNVVSNTTCDPAAGTATGTGTVRFAATCFRADIGTASGEAVAGTGHLGARSHADSHNGNSLGAGIDAEAGFTDNVLIFTSSDPNATTASVSANLILEGFLEATGPVASAGIEGSLNIGAGGGAFLYVLDAGGNLDARNSFIVDSGAVGHDTDLHMHTAFTTVPLNTPVSFIMSLHSGVFASGPGSHALSDFAANSFKFAPAAFFLPDGVTVNGGDYLVNNRFIDPLAPAVGVPEPSAWALMIAGFGLAGAALRRRRALTA